MEYSVGGEYNQFERTELLDTRSLKTPYLVDVLDEFSPFPAYSLLFGVGQDGLPLLFDLVGSSAESFLICGDDEDGNLRVLRNLLSSACLLNTREEVNLHLLTPSPDFFEDLHRQPSFKISFKPTDPECKIVIEEMVNLLHQRRAGREPFPIHILAVDGLDELISGLDSETQLLFNWLVEYGPEFGVWVFATIQTTRIQKTHFIVIEGFQSRILGMVQFPRLARYLSGDPHNALREIISGEEAIVRTGGEYYPVLIPETNH